MSIGLNNIEYGGKAVQDVVRAAISQAGITQAIAPTVRQGFKGKAIIPEMDERLALKDYTVCANTTGQDFTYNERKEDLCELDLATRMNHNTFVSTYQEAAYQRGFQSEKISQTLAYQTLIAYLRDRAADDLSKVMLNGDSTNPYGLLSFCDGLIKKLDDSSDVHKPTGTLTNLRKSDPTASKNVYTELQKAIEALPNRVRYKNTKGNANNIKVMVAPSVAETLSNYFRKSNEFFFSPAEGTKLSIGVGSFTYDVVPIVHMNEGEVVVTDPKNIYWFTDDTSDFNEIKIIDESRYSECDRLFLRMKFRSLMTVGRFDEVTYYVAS
jgi:hypothetical protein